MAIRPAILGTAAMPTNTPAQYKAGQVLVKQNDIKSDARVIDEREHEAYHLDTAASVEFARNDRADVVLDETQRAAVQMFRTNQYACLVGYAGTGKTTSMKNVLAAMRDDVGTLDWGAFRTAGEAPNLDRRPSIALCCFTNVAAKNLASKLDPDWAPHCMSIHSLLCYRPVRQDYLNENGREVTIFEPAYNATNRLPVRAIFIDETGIVSKTLWDALYAACTPETRIYFLGDLAQLPAIQGVSPLPFAMKKWPSIELKKIYRQQGDSEIVPNLTRIRSGLFPQHHDNDFRCGQMETLAKGDRAAQEYVKKYIGALFQRGIWNPMRDVILTPLNGGALGQEHWNTQFRFIFNPPKRDEKGKLLNPPILINTATGPIHLSVGDKVMATDNGGRTSREVRFSNGSIGIVVGIEPNPDYRGIITNFDHDAEYDMMDLFDLANTLDDEKAAAADITLRHADEEADDDVKRRAASHIVYVQELATGDMYTLSRSSEISTLQHAYAATAHKFQGSQAANVLVLCHSSMQFGLNREWLYTACSRAQKKVFLLHDPDALTRAVTNVQLKGSTTDEKVDRLLAHYQKNKGWAIPFIPENHKL